MTLTHTNFENYQTLLPLTMENIGYKFGRLRNAHTTPNARKRLQMLPQTKLRIEKPQRYQGVTLTTDACLGDQVQISQKGKDFQLKI